MSLRDARVHLVDSVDTAAELMRWLSTKELIGFDTEGTGINPEVDHVRLVQVGTQECGWAIPWHRWGGVFEEIVRRYDGWWVAHNATYDYAMLAKEGIKLPTHRIHDTRLMAHVLESTGSTALKKLANRYVDPNATAGQERLDEAIGGKGGWTWATVPIDFEPYWVYGALDPVLTVRLFDELYPRVQTEAPQSYDLELAVAWVCERMERRGTRVDRAYVTRFAEELEAYAQQVTTWCRTNYGINPGSDVEVITALQAAGVNLTKRTGSGARYSVDKEVLESIDHPLAQAVLNRRRAVKVISTYLENYLQMSERDGLIHPSINTIGGTDKNPFEPGGGKGVRTGRMSCSDPNLQNVPVRTAMGARIRNAFIPRDGNRWIKCDADQIEMRILAHVAQDQAMIEAFHSEGDFFVNLARKLFADPDFTKADPRRQLVKNGGYAKIYGAGIPKFAKTAGVPEPEAGAFMRQFDAMFPGVRRLQSEIERQARERYAEEGVAYVRSPLTNRRHVADKGREYALLNYEIQGTAGEVLKMKIVEADQAGLGEFMLFPVHDEVDFDVPEGQVSDVLATLNDVMNDDKLLSVPVTWSAEVGPRWGECK
jgi:DNA polymerase-1